MKMTGKIIKLEGNVGVIHDDKGQEFWFTDSIEDDLKEGDEVSFFPELYKTSSSQLLMARFVRHQKEKTNSDIPNTSASMH